MDSVGQSHTILCQNTHVAGRVGLAVEKSRLPGAPGLAFETWDSTIASRLGFCRRVPKVWRFVKKVSCPGEGRVIGLRDS